MKKVGVDEAVSWAGRVIDVRGYDEFLTGRLERAQCVPLQVLVGEAQGWNRQEPILLTCKSGMRATQAAQQLESLGFQNLAVLDGGVDACQRKGIALVRERKTLPIMQQAMVVAGGMVLAGLALSYVHPAWLILSAIAGAGLVVAGATGFCLMAKLLSFLPWNRVNCTGSTCSR